MPTTGQKDADGYTWNGGAWVSQDGYAKGSPEDKKSKRGWVSKAWDFGTDVAKDMASDLTKIDTWVDPTGGRRDGAFGWLHLANDTFNPITNFGKSAQNIRDAKSPLDIAKAVGWGAMGVADVFGLGQTAGAGLTLAGKTVKAGSRGADTFEALAKNLVGKKGFDKAYTFWKGVNPSKVGKVGSVGQMAFNTGGVLMGPDAPKPTASSVLPGPSYTMTAEEMQRRAAMERNRTDAAGNSGMGGRRVVGDVGIEQRPPGGYPGAPAAAVPAPLDLAPLTPEQLNATGQDLVELEQVYQDALNQYGLAEKRGQQGYVQDVQGARRRAAGSAQDLASQLAASGMDISPAAAFGAGQMTNAPRMARETSARKTLDQLLAEITTGRTQARTQRDRNKLMTNNQINAYRNQNSFDAQQAAYERMAGN